VPSPRISPHSRSRSRKQSPPAFVERLALTLEGDGFPRIAGRIFGLLIISENESSLDDLAASLGASKASVSVNTRMLEGKGLIERVSRPGDRRDYYRISIDPFVCTMEQRIAKWNRVRAVMSDGVNDHSISPEARARLRDYERASAEVADILSAAMNKMKSARKK
jgi:DNA-binding transcriptional regulator GbsR (MarR family)